MLKILTDERTRRQVNNLRHATNSELLCEAFLHAFTGQPLPNDEDLRKERSDEIPEAAKEDYARTGHRPGHVGILKTIKKGRRNLLALFSRV
ncbi:transcriptional repressor protein MetJ [Klebsiella michiganensis]|uniref:Met repressor n=1 Tax=Klebsiella michiganensis TaxID=1134687 RepID=A0A7H4PEA1_9ENTR|nr:transcriptional repressor protein MetJ [Klebsiella michiganensis]